MNIHFYDKKLFEFLKEISFTRVRIGSHMYGVDNKDSDIDYLYIYMKPQGLADSFLWEHHQLQFKEDGIDHNFTDLHSFIRNIMTGDSTINFEVLHSNEFRANNDLNFLYENRKWFYSYNIIRSYLGLSRRDLKMCTKVRPKTNGINYKKLYHAARGMRASELLMRGAYENEVSDLFYSQYLRDIKEEKISNTKARCLIECTETSLSQIREELNRKFEAKEINRIMSVEHMQLLDAWLQGFTHDKTRMWGMNTIPFYEALENGIKYD